MNKKRRSNSPTLSWHIVEKAIQKECSWLEDAFNIQEKANLLPFSEAINRKILYHYFYRFIAKMIVEGKVRARAIKSPNLWIKKNKYTKSKQRHGGHWHKKMMRVIENHFKDLDFDIVTEPNLHHGRADLGIFKKGYKDLYIEVGTTSIYKLFVNLQMMNNCILLIVPEETKVIEFEIEK